jgi:hypothetical protein
MVKENVVYIQKGVLLGHKELNYVVFRKIIELEINILSEIK